MLYLGLYAVAVILTVMIREWGHRSSLERFLVADRSLGGFVGSMSIAASWIWAPAIFVSTQTGFTWGVSGLVWFVLPNMAALLLFAPLAERVRRSLPDGYSYIQYLSRGDPSFMKVQCWLQLVMQVLIFGIQLVAGAELLSTLTGGNYLYLVVGMATIPLVYCCSSGLRTSVFLDSLQYAVISSAALAILASFPRLREIKPMLEFNPFDYRLLVEFGISSAFGLLVAIFADHQQWQRAFAIKSGRITGTFCLAALLHGVVTTSLGALGCLVFSTGFTPNRKDLVGVEFVTLNYPSVFVPIFVVMALCALLSTLDSALCAFSSLATQHLGTKKATLKGGRMWMLVLSMGGVVIAASRPSLITLWFIACTIRLASFAPTVLSVLSTKPPTKTYSIATLLGLIGGGSVFCYGVYASLPGVRTAGMVLTVLLSATILLLEGRRGLLQRWIVSGLDGISNRATTMR